MGVSFGEDRSFTTLAACQGAEGKCAWSTQSTPNQVPLTRSSDKKVSCYSASKCVAVAYDAYLGKSFLEVWNGSSWKVGPTLSAGEIKAIACAAESSCILVGSENELPASWEYSIGIFGEIFWLRTVASPSGIVSGALRSISCTAASTCTAVGWYRNSTNEYKPLVERLSGSWSQQSAPMPAEGNGAEAMLAVSCASATSCTTVGTAASKPTAETWNGSSWSLITPQNPAGVGEAALEAVSCPAADSCFAVGRSTTSGHDKALVERLSGSSWSIATIPNPSAAGVSAASPAPRPASASPSAAGSTPKANRFPASASKSPPKNERWPRAGTAPNGPCRPRPTRWGTNGACSATSTAPPRPTASASEPSTRGEER